MNESSCHTRHSLLDDRLHALIRQAGDAAGEADRATRVASDLDGVLAKLQTLRSGVSSPRDVETLAWATLADLLAGLAAIRVEWRSALPILAEIEQLAAIARPLRAAAERVQAMGPVDAIRALDCPAAFAAALAWCRHLDEWDTVLDDLSSCLRSEVRTDLERLESRLCADARSEADRCELEPFEDCPEIEAILAGVSPDSWRSYIPDARTSDSHQVGRHPVESLIERVAAECGLEEMGERIVNELRAFATRMPVPVGGPDSVGRGSPYALAARMLAGLAAMGVPLDEALAAVSAAPELPTLSRSIRIASENMRAGTTVSMALRKEGFPAVVCDAAAWGEASGAMEDSLVRAANMLLDAT